MSLKDMYRHATILDNNPDIQELCAYQESLWDDLLMDLMWASAFDGVYLGAGEGNLLVETRKPALQTADYAQVTQTTTSKNWLPQDGTPFMFPKNYWDGPKAMRFTAMGRMTTGTTPGSHTTEIRHQAAQPLTDAGGTILATSTAVAANATKTSISWLIFGRVYSRSQIGSASALFAWALFISNQLSVVLPAANIPQMIPESVAASTNVDTQAAGGLSIQGKNSGANASTITVHDLHVEAPT